MDWTRKRLVAGSLAALVALSLTAGCGDGDDGGGGGGSAGGDGAAEETTPSAPAGDDGGGKPESGDAVTIKGFEFGPAELAAAAGTEVTWTNDDGATHTVTAKEGPDGFESDDLSSGDTFSFTFEEPGTYDYYCSIHPTMTASVSVE